MDKSEIEKTLTSLKKQLEGQPDEYQLNAISQELANLEQPLEDADKLMLLDDDNSVGSKINKLKTTIAELQLMELLQSNKDIGKVNEGCKAIIKEMAEMTVAPSGNFLQMVDHVFDLYKWQQEIDAIEEVLIIDGIISKSKPMTYEDIERRINKLYEDLRAKSELLSDSALSLKILGEVNKLQSYLNSKSTIKDFIEKMKENEGIVPKKGDRVYDLIRNRPGLFKKAMIRCMDELESSDMDGLKRMLELEEHYKRIATLPDEETEAYLIAYSIMNEEGKSQEEAIKTLLEGNMELVKLIEKQILKLGDDFDVTKSRGQQTLVNVLTIRKYADLECPDAGPKTLQAQYNEMRESKKFVEIFEALDGGSDTMTSIRRQSIFREGDEYGGGGGPKKR